MSLDRLAAQSIADSAPTFITWDTQTFDSEDWWDPGTPDRFLLPAGVFVVQAWVQWTANATGSRALTIRRTASGTLGRVRAGGALAAELTEQSLHVIAQNTVDTFHSVEVEQRSTAALNVGFAKVRCYQVQAGA